MRSTSRRLQQRGAKLAAVLVLSAALAGCDANKRSKNTVDKHGAEATTAETSVRNERAQILKTLADEDAPDDARLDSIHSARDLQIADATPALRKLLSDDNPDIVVAAAAALDGLDAKDADLALIEAAGHLGRARQFEHLRQLLYLIGSVGGPRTRTYLETVAEGHELSPIRDTAAQILKDSFSER